MKPDESLFKAHLEGAGFQAGADSGKWGIHGSVDTIGWPYPILWVRADKRIVAEGRIYLRFTINNYPQFAPTGCPWDIRTNTPLSPSLWPRGNVTVSTVFNPAWNAQALYAPCDRMAMNGHDAWKTQSSQWWWQPTFTITRYLEFVHVCLNPADHANA
jgi:hypothetical protein